MAKTLFFQNGYCITIGGYDEGEKRRGEEEEGSKRTWDLVK